jgi:hypothetical protein
MMLCLTFGGAPCPSEWGSVAESICNLVMAILQSDKWDPLSFFVPAQHHIPQMKILPNKIPFDIGRDLIVDIPVNPRGTMDIYIKFFIDLIVDIKGLYNSTRLERAPLLDLSTVA